MTSMLRWGLGGPRIRDSSIAKGTYPNRPRFQQPDRVRSPFCVWFLSDYDRKRRNWPLPCSRIHS